MRYVCLQDALYSSSSPLNVALMCVFRWKSYEAFLLHDSHSMTRKNIYKPTRHSMKDVQFWCQWHTYVQVKSCNTATQRHGAMMLSRWCDARYCSSVMFTDLSKKCSTSIFTVEDLSQYSSKHQVSVCMAHSSALKLEAVLQAATSQKAVLLTGERSYMTVKLWSSSPTVSNGR